MFDAIKVNVRDTLFMSFFLQFGHVMQLDDGRGGGGGGGMAEVWQIACDLTAVE